MKTIKLKVEKVNNHFILVDESTEIKECDYFYRNSNGINNIYKANKIVGKSILISVNSLNDSICWVNCSTKIIFADKELNLDLPTIPDWKQYEINKDLNIIWERFIKSDINNGSASSFLEYLKINHYNTNKDKYTKDDIIKAIEKTQRSFLDSSKIGESTCSINDIIQSLEKYPKYIVVETETKQHFEPNKQKRIDVKNGLWYEEKPKLITTQEGYQTGIMTELIW